MAERSSMDSALFLQRNRNREDASGEGRSPDAVEGTSAKPATVGNPCEAGEDVARVWDRTVACRGRTMLEGGDALVQQNRGGARAEQGQPEIIGDGKVSRPATTGSSPDQGEWVAGVWDRSVTDRRRSTAISGEGRKQGRVLRRHRKSSDSGDPDVGWGGRSGYGFDQKWRRRGWNFRTIRRSDRHRRRGEWRALCWTRRRTEDALRQRLKGV